MEIGVAFSLIEKTIDDRSGPPRAYLFSGGVDACAELSRRILVRLYPGAPELAASGMHPDVFRAAPAGKRREIPIETVRENITGPLSQSSYSGSWKTAIIEGADRLNVQSANTLLKTLEEPPPKTFFMLFTDTPDAVLPTILSRVQRIDLPAGNILLEGEAFDKVRMAMEEMPHGTLMDRLAAGRALCEVFEETQAEEDAEPAAAAKAFFRTVMHFVRGWMESGAVEPFKSFRNVEAVEAAARRHSRSLNIQAVLCRMAERIAYP